MKVCELVSSLLILLRALPSSLLGFLRFLVVRAILALLVQRQFMRCIDFVFFEFSQQPFVRQIQRMRMLPVMVRNRPQPFHHFGRVYFNRQFSPAIETAELD
jgi:hypothetical protein